MGPQPLNQGSCGNCSTPRSRDAISAIVPVRVHRNGTMKAGQRLPPNSSVHAWLGTRTQPPDSRIHACPPTGHEHPCLAELKDSALKQAHLCCSVGLLCGAALDLERFA
eukprot:8638323-Alexandrium_andersonii.AAC.1